jgi:hypothetical protein
VEAGQTNPRSIGHHIIGLDCAFARQAYWGNDYSVRQDIEAFIADNLNCEYRPGMSL